MTPSGQVQRKCSDYFTQVMYADRTEASERGSFETGLLVPLLPTPFFLSFFLTLSLSLSSSGVHVIGCFWFLMYSVLWEVTIFGTLEMFTPQGATTTKIL